MAVQKHDEVEFDAPASLVVQAVRAVLLQSPAYRRTSEQEMRFTTNVRPHWWLLGTDMTIDLHPGVHGTRVSVSTRSQWFITGDVFDCYNHYIREFLYHLQTQLQGKTPG